MDSKIVALSNRVAWLDGSVSSGRYNLFVDSSMAGAAGHCLMDDGSYAFGSGFVLENQLSNMRKGENKSIGGVFGSVKNFNVALSELHGALETLKMLAPRVARPFYEDRAQFEVFIDNIEVVLLLQIASDFVEYDIPLPPTKGLPPNYGSYIFNEATPPFFPSTSLKFQDKFLKTQLAIRELIKLRNDIHVTFHWIKGHDARNLPHQLADKISRAIRIDGHARKYLKPFHMHGIIGRIISDDQLKSMSNEKDFLFSKSFIERGIDLHGDTYVVMEKKSKNLVTISVLKRNYQESFEVRSKNPIELTAFLDKVMDSHEVGDGHIYFLGDRSTQHITDSITLGTKTLNELMNTKSAKHKMSVMHSLYLNVLSKFDPFVPLGSLMR